MLVGFFLDVGRASALELLAPVAGERALHLRSLVANLVLQMRSLEFCRCPDNARS
jgi:hypothetical protein